MAALDHRPPGERAHYQVSGSLIARTVCNASLRPERIGLEALLAIGARLTSPPDSEIILGADAQPET
jgi:hypothetical protein